MSARCKFLALLASLAWTTLVWVASSPEAGDLSHHYTDHLRHMGEALALSTQGFDFYERTYDEATREITLPCAAHEHLFGDRTAPYPPLGILVHLPFALMERAGWLAPRASHRAVVAFWSLVACLTCWLMARQLRGQPKVAWLGFAALFAPLCLGMGANGFFDIGFVLFGVLGAKALSQNHQGAGLLALAFSVVSHFRALVFAPWALDALLKGFHRERRKTLIGAGLGLAVATPALVAAFLLSGTLETIPPHNPVHYTHLKLRLLVFVVVGMGAAGLLWHWRERTCAWTAALAVLLGVLERSHGWWHASVLLAPAVVLSAKAIRVPSRTWLTAWLFVLITGAVAYKHPLTPFWQWVAFALRGVH